MRSNEQLHPDPDLLLVEPTSEIEAGTGPVAATQYPLEDIEADTDSSNRTPGYPEPDPLIWERDQRLLDAIAGEDSAAFKTLWELYEPRITRFCQSSINQKSPLGAFIDDIKQEVSLAAWQKFTKERFELDHHQSVISWLKIVTRNKIADLYRNLNRTAEPVADIPEKPTDDGRFEILEAALSYGGLYQALSKLSDRQHTVLYYRVLLQYSADETAEILESTPGAVRVTQHRALARLRQWLTGSCLDPDTASDAA